MFFSIYIFWGLFFQNYCSWEDADLLRRIKVVGRPYSLPPHLPDASRNGGGLPLSQEIRSVPEPSNASSRSFCSPNIYDFLQTTKHNNKQNSANSDQRPIFPGDRPRRHIHPWRAVTSPTTTTAPPHSLEQIFIKLIFYTKLSYLLLFIFIILKN